MTTLPYQRYHRIAFASFCFVAASLSSIAQETLTGIVTNSATGQNLEGARVVLKSAGREVLTDSQGVYRFVDVPAGTTVVSVSYTGLTTMEQPVEIRPGARNQHNVGLTSDIYQLSQFVVSGEREGMAQAITLQRNSDGVKSIVSADAFGGLAGNPAELVARLPGIEGESVGGDVRYIRVRGLNHNLSSVTMDGNRVADAASAGTTREFQFQTIGSDAIERIEVVKLPTPDMDGDSIGGNINMVSKSAFDSTPERRIRGSVGTIWRIDDDRDRPRPNLSFSYSEVFGGRFAVALNAAYRAHASIAEQTTQTHQSLAAGTAGPAYTHTFTFTDFRNLRKRSGVGLRFDYKLSERSRFFANWQYNKHVEHEDGAEANFQTNQGIAAVNAAGQFTGNNGIIPGFTDTVTEVRAVNNSRVTLTSGNLYKDGRTQNINAGGVHRFPSLEINYDAYVSSSKANYAGTSEPSFIARSVGWRLDRTENAYLPTITQTAGPDWTDISSYTQNEYTIARRASWDEYEGASLNVQKNFDTRFPVYVKTGYRLREQTRLNVGTPFEGVYVGPDGVMGPNAAAGGRNDDNLEQFVERRELPGDLGRYPNLPFPRVVGKGRTFWTALQENPSHFAADVAGNVQDELTAHTRFKESIDAYYLMSSVKVGPASLLAGVRVETTKVWGEGSLQQVTAEERARRAAFTGPLTTAEITRRTIAEFGSRQTREGKTRDVLPGVHLKYSPFPNAVVRLGWARNIGRPSIGQLVPSTTVNDEARTIRTSNPELKAQKADNYDLSLEYYFEPAGVVTAGLFRKDIESFIFTAGGDIIPTGQDNGFNGQYAGYTLTTQHNGGQAKVQGIELSYNQQFQFLPGWWKGFGAFANLTKMEAEGNYGTGTALSSLAPTPKIAGFNPFNANVGVSYIRNNLTVRVQWNYRDRYLLTFNANESRLVYARKRETLGIKTAYRFNRNFEAYFDVVNLLSEPDREREFTGGRPQVYSMLLPQFYFGVNLRK